MKVSEVYDIETLSNLFTYTSYVIEEDKWYVFVIHQNRNDSFELYKHLLRGNFFQIGFNNNNFDYPILHHFINHFSELQYKSGYEIAQDLYLKAQNLINDDNKFKEISDKNKYIFQIDLFTVWHYNNKARRASLKDLEFAMNMENVQEMPIHHEQFCTKNDIDLVLQYNKNDVVATVEFYKITLGQTEYPIYKGRNKMSLRSQFKKMFNIPCLNWPDVKIGEQLLLTLYCRENRLNPKIVKTWRTPRNIIKLKDCIPFWCNITSKEFAKFLDVIEHKEITPGSEFSESILFHGIYFDFGLGGSHGCIKPGIYKSSDSLVIMDLDISSLYPSISKSLNLYPKHLGESFNKQYSQFIGVRIAEKHKPKAERNNALIEGYKLLLNGAYGKSGEETSFLYDPLYTYKTTIAGQLFICMWAERMVKKVPELEFIQINTDGITIRLPKNKINLIREVYLQLEKETGLASEEAFYNQMIIRDVNNYIAEYQDHTNENPHVKLKGCFEIYKEFHKDPSMKIVPIALYEYFINNVPVEKTIREHKNIFDFCLRLKINHSSKAFYSTIIDNKVSNIELDRTTRYFASTNGGGLTVYYNGSNSMTRLNKDFQFTLFNKYYKSDNYNIDYQFYIREANKIKDVIEDLQLSLF